MSTKVWYGLCLPMVLTNYIWDVWNFEFPIFYEFFFENFKFTIVAYGYNGKFGYYLESECS